ncbi:NACHT and WD domain protein [Halenospora varia]|nr:NACHT and WD domain protein [Halenospora varia]
MADDSSIESFERKDSAFSITDTVPTRYTSFASVSNRFSRATTLADGVAEDTKGPLGLSILYSPIEPFVDFVFVHGLGGGSRKTWSKTSSIADYWPQEWLPKDPSFQGVRIHSFGYDSDWVKGKDNCLNIRHFGKSLLGELSTSPCLIDSNLPIVLIGHSMGGLVIKKAYMLARQNKASEDLAKRIHTMCFLATPHKGSDSAKLLSNVLQVANSSRAYVSELKKGSYALQAINDEFCDCSSDVVLWSFYETQKLSIGGLFSTLIVDPESAVLSYPQEKRIPMTADHRSICKFSTVTDPNYIIIRNSLASIVSGLSNTVTKSVQQQSRYQVNELQKYLGVSNELEDDFFSADDAYLPGTCQWLSTKSRYSKWKGFDPDSPRIFWVSGKPATGKSILASYAIRQLQATGAQCSYFFFKYGDKSKSRLSACLRSIAFQMARANAGVRQALLNMYKDEIHFDKDNERTIWRKLFLSGIFQTVIPAQYWVIDALDECGNSTLLFDLILSKLDKSIPLRILITSRETADLAKGFSTIGHDQVLSENISPLDTLPDIRLLVETKKESLVVKDEIDRASLVEKIVEKSKGSFLWTVLVLKELSNSYSEKEVNHALEDVPGGMKPLYSRTLDLMSQVTRGKELSKAILIWATSTTRPLSSKELEDALKLDMKDNFLKLIEETISELCGQLVTLDRSGKVQMVHETAREFLFDDDLRSEFAINKREAHTRIARTCLTYLAGDEMKPPRSGRRGNTNAKRSEFLMYACAAFSYHLAKADPLANDILILVDKFLKKNILSWIEVIGRTKDLIPLIRTSKNLRTYLNACSAERSPLGTEMQTIRGWTTDLIRLTAKFADALIISPPAIYSLIPPFCPADSTVFKVGSSGRRLSVLGLSNTQWDDRLSCIEFHGQTSALSYGDGFFAIGTMAGTIALYHASSCQEYKILDHGEKVKYLQFKAKSDLMASCGMKHIRIWDIRSGQIIHTFQAPRIVISMVFDENHLVIACQKNYLASWNLDDDGAKLPDRPWNNSAKYREGLLPGTPRAISISTGHKMMALAYTGQPIILWDLEEDIYYGTCGKKLPNGETSTHVVSVLVLNPNANISLLAASYLDGEVVLLDPFSDDQIENVHADCHTLAASPDGRLLAGGTAGGMFHIYEFDTLRLLYRVKSSNYFIKQLAFSKDSLRLADIRGSQCNIWEPAVLLRDLAGDDSSVGTVASVFEAVVPEIKVKVSAIAIHPLGEVVFCAQEDGTVCLRDMKTGAFRRTLYSHKSRVPILTWWPQSSIIMSIDGSNGVIAWQLKKLQGHWEPENMLFQSHLEEEKSSCIIQLLISEEAKKFILSTRESDYLWTIDGQQENARTYSKTPGIRKWAQHPKFLTHVICVDETVARIHTWDDWSEVMCISLGIETKGLQLKSVASYRLGLRWRILIEQSELDGTATTCGIHVLDADVFDFKNEPVENALIPNSNILKDVGPLSPNENISTSSRTVADVPPQHDDLADCIAHVIGISDASRLIFLNAQSWVCSVALSDLESPCPSYTRHFFVPYDWFSGTRVIVCEISRRDVLFARNEDAVIIKGGLEFTELVKLETKSSATRGRQGLLKVF